MLFEFLNILFLCAVFAGMIILVDVIWRHYKRQHVRRGKQPIIIDYARSFFPVLLFVVIIRSFLFQPYRVPTGSLEPTVIPGDFIFVSQYNYGLNIPLWNKTIVPMDKPQRGQIALFRWPVNPTITFVKRVIGVPGDHISYIDKTLYINGQEMTKTFFKNTIELGSRSGKEKAQEYEENLAGIKHHILINPNRPSQNFYNLVIPKGQYFMMGDNRDDSDDSRMWGFVPMDHFIGKALWVWMNWDSRKYQIHWNRIGTRLSPK